MAGHHLPVRSRAPLPSITGAARFEAGNSRGDGAPGDGGGIPRPGIAGHLILRLIGPGLRPASAAIYRRDVADFLRWWDRRPEAATPADVVRYLAVRATSPASADRRLAILAYFYRAGIAAHSWTGDPTTGIARARRGAWR